LQKGQIVYIMPNSIFLPKKLKHMPTQPNPQWFKDAIIYELPIKSFYDSNDDGIGDFRGALEKLDYLQNLGVTAVWILPFFPSPLKDDGYDIADYYSVNPIYGTLDDSNLYHGFCNLDCYSGIRYKDYYHFNERKKQVGKPFRK